MKVSTLGLGIQCRYLRKEVMIIPTLQSRIFSEKLTGP
jgi:hypothetical protein